MITSQLGPVMNALVLLAREALDCPVIDGPIVSGNLPNALVVIGSSDLDETGDWIAATAEQEWAALGARSRKEVGNVYGVAIAWTGEADDARTARDQCLANVASLEEALRLQPQLGLQPSVNWAGIAINQIRQLVDEAGLGVWVSFTVQYRANLSAS